jgi:hypothetical protein
MTEQASRFVVDIRKVWKIAIKEEGGKVFPQAALETTAAACEARIGEGVCL